MVREPLPAKSDDYFGQNAADEAFREACKDLREFWRVGRDSRENSPGYRAGPGVKDEEGKREPTAKREEAAKLGWNPERLRQARLFASRCTEEELEQRIAEAKEHNYPPYWSTLTAVYGVTDRAKRESLWKDCLIQTLSRRDVVERIQAANLPRQVRVAAAGRTVDEPESVQAARVRLMKEAGRLLRVNDACARVLGRDGLPPDARRALQRAVRAATDLQDALVKLTSRRRRKPQ